jgi:8-amino-7-oxononanoate synthase
MASMSATDLWQAQSADLAALAGKARLRALAPRPGVDFASTITWAWRARRACARRWPMPSRAGGGGIGRIALLRGNDPEHEALEAEAAAFFGCESALWFSAGYAGNVALISTLPQRGDLVICDELIHASVHEGLRLTRAATAMAAHNDADAFEDAARHGARRATWGGSGSASKASIPWMAIARRWMTW